MTHASEISLIERLGGEARLASIVDDFVDRVLGDMMIGFHFKGVDVPRLKQREFEFARGHLGGGGTYTGRPIAAAHAPHKILGGHFNRRLRILEQTLEDHGVPRDVIDAWLSHNDALRRQVTGSDASTCLD